MQRTCKQCAASFEVTQSDLAFLEKVSPVFSGKKYSIPPPDLCSQCRFRERLAWRTELHLHQRKSDKSGREILSMYPPAAACVVYSPEEWWRDDWSALDEGRAYDFGTPFFEQFAQLLRTVPLRALSLQANQNSDYINNAGWNRNCYLLAGANHNEDCYYGNFVNYCRNCVDNSFLDHCELCYECIDCTKCYNLRYSQNCSNCSDSAFLMSCRGCRRCFGCVNMAEKEYCFLNEQLTKEAYEQRLAQTHLDLRSRVEEAQVFFDKHRLQFPHKYMIGELNEDVTGNVILRSRRVSEGFEVSDCEDIRYCSWFHQARDCMDCYAWGMTAEECYECTEVGDRSSRVLFSAVMYQCRDALYSYSSEACHDVFGSASLRRNSYCILNRQYTQGEYEAIVPKIIEHMQQTGEWGNFFPMWVCPFAYNQTVAQDEFPLTREQAGRLGAKWNEGPPVEASEREKVPDAVKDVDEDICEKILTCRDTEKPYRIIKQEFRFLKKHGIPIPTKGWYARHLTRLRKRNPRRLWDRTCAKCQKPIQTSYPPDRPEIVYCERCYLETVY